MKFFKWIYSKFVFHYYRSRRHDILYRVEKSTGLVHYKSYAGTWVLSYNDAPGVQAVSYRVTVNWNDI